MGVLRVPQNMREAELSARLRHAEVRYAHSKELAARAARICESDREAMLHIKQLIEANKHHG